MAFCRNSQQALVVRAHGDPTNAFGVKLYGTWPLIASLGGQELMGRAGAENGFWNLHSPKGNDQHVA